MNTLQTHILIIGAGPAGLAAAAGALITGELIQLAQNTGHRPVVVIDRDMRIGGILNQCIHDGFGLERYRETLTGPEYVSREAQRLDDHPEAIKILTDTFARSIKTAPGGAHPSIPPRFIVETLSQGTLLRIEAASVILAMGCRERPAGAISLPGTRPAGIFTAGTAQRLINLQNLRIGSRAVIIGSGDIGLIMARRLHLEGITVAAVTEIRPYPGGLARNVRQCLTDLSIPLLTSTAVIEVVGEQRVTGVRVAPLADGTPDLQKLQEIPCDTILLSVGLIPEHDLATDGLAPAIDPRTGGFLVDQHFMTTVPGLYACGNLLFAHDLVDQVSDEAQKTGAAAAQWAVSRETRSPAAERRAATESADQNRIPMQAGSGISLVVPQCITGITTALRDTGHASAPAPIVLSYRVTAPKRRGEIRVVYHAGAAHRVVTMDVRHHVTPAITYQSTFTLPETVIEMILSSSAPDGHLEVTCE